jgi:predicted nucleic acid-binding protein
MILVDTSVFIDFLRAKDPRMKGHFATFGAAVCGAVRAEVLAGALSPAHAAKLAAALNALPQIPTPESVWDIVGEHLAALRRNGLTAGFVDVVIATAAMTAGLELWTRDKFLLSLPTHLPGLRLFPEPP